MKIPTYKSKRRGGPTYSVQKADGDNRWRVVEIEKDTVRHIDDDASSFDFACRTAKLMADAEADLHKTAARRARNKNFPATFRVIEGTAKSVGLEAVFLGD